MNHVNFNDGLRIPRHLLPPDDTMPDKTETSPLFEWEDLGEFTGVLAAAGVDEIIERIQEEPVLLPFNPMRLYVSTGGRKVGYKAYKVWLCHEGGRLNVRVAFLECGLDHVTAGVRSRPSDGRLEFWARKPTQPVGFEKGDQQLSEALQLVLTGVFASVCRFIREVSLPSNFITSVTPDKKGKSVEWVKARTHYVILHKAHPANSKEVSAGSTVSRTMESIKRQAHTRRAHARILRSPRFRNKLGLTIYVKATWVGPSEWKENGSIYRMVPRNQHFH